MDPLEYTFYKNLDSNIPNNIRYQKHFWKSRISTPENNKVLERIINLGYEVLIKKVAGNTIDFENEASMQMQFGILLNNIGKMFEYNPNDLFNIELESNFKSDCLLDKSGSNKSLIDVVMSFGNRQFFSTAAIELKFFKKINHREPNNRYDVFCDINNLEEYGKKHFDLCYFIILTDHEHYVKQKKYSNNTDAFDFRHQTVIKKGTILKYCTKKPYGKPITINNDYQFMWEVNNMYDLRKLKQRELYSMLLKIK